MAASIACGVAALCRADDWAAAAARDGERMERADPRADAGSSACRRVDAGIGADRHAAAESAGAGGSLCAGEPCRAGGAGARRWRKRGQRASARETPQGDLILRFAGARPAVTRLASASPPTDLEAQPCDALIELAGTGPIVTPRPINWPSHGRRWRIRCLLERR